MTSKVVGLIIVMAVVISETGAPNARENSLPLPEYKLKAFYLYNFPKFVNWPADAFEDENSPLILSILGKDPFGSELDPIKGETVKGRKLLIKRVAKIEDLKPCHVLFISASEKERLPQIMDKIKDWYVLTVGDMENFAERGGIIGLFQVKLKIRFAINVASAKRNHLRINSQLLKLATIVKEERQ